MLANFHATEKPLLDCNMCIKILTNLTRNQPGLPFHQLSKWLKFIELSMAMILGNTKDEKCFKNLRSMKRKLRNMLTTHLDLVVKVFAQKFFTLNTFLIVVTMNS
jgi:hypothetical protein